MTTPSLEVMGQALTPPYRRGMETREVPLGPVAPDGSIALGQYDHQDYLDRYGRFPQAPAYLLVARFAPEEPLEVTLSFTRTPASAEETAVVWIDRTPLAGRAHAIPIGGAVDAELRLTKLSAAPDPPAGAPADAWRIVVLLGNLAKLMWTVGAEHEELLAQATEVAAQRARSRARRASLDLLGADLGVARFPATAYSVDADTVALYHLDDVPPAGQLEPPTAFDEVERHRPGGGHPAANVGQVARSRQAGRFKSGFGFRAGAGGVLYAPDHADFAVPPDAGMTAEATVRPSPRGEAPVPGTIVAKRAVLNDPAEAGWALAVGSFRAFDNNLRLTVSDGTEDVALYADHDLGDGAFHHVAGTVERRGGGAMVRLWLDGRIVAERRMPALGALTTAAPLQIGNGREQPAGGAPLKAAEFDGAVDEVRVSRLARGSFHPVVGEGDDEYRRRLGIFERWQLPSPSGLERAINELVQLSRLGITHSESFKVVEDDKDLALATRALRVVPRTLARGGCVAGDGRLRVSEPEVAGTPADDPDFDPAWLVRHDSPQVIYGAEEQRRMQRSLAASLDALLARIPGIMVRVRAGYDPAAGDDLRAVGRALVLTADGRSAETLAGDALSAGFDSVCRTVDDRVRVAQRASEALGVRTQADPGVVPPAGSDAGPGDELVLSVLPFPLPLAAQVTWSIVACGEGDAAFLTAAGDLSPHAAGQQARLRAGAAGNVVVRVSATLRERRAEGTRGLRIGLPRTGAGALATSASIGGDGRLAVTESVASGGPSSFFHPVYLDAHAVAGVDYGANPLNRRMQRRVARALDRMIGFLGGGTLRVERAYDPAETDLHREGRALQLSHSALDGRALAAAAFAAGFDFVQRLVNDRVHVSMRAGELAQIELDDASGDVVRVDAAARCRVWPQATPGAVAFAPDGATAYVANRGSSSVTALAIPTGEVAQLRTLPVSGVALVDRAPVALAVAPNGQRLWTTSAEHGTVSVVATQPTLSPSGSFATGPRPVDLAVRPDGSRLYAACAGDATLRVHNAGSGAQVASVALGAPPAAVAVTPNGAQAWVACATGVVVVDLAGNAVSGAPIVLPGAADIAISPDGATAWVALPAQRQVQAITAATRALAAPVDVQSRASRVVLSADGELLWIAAGEDDVVRALRIATGKLDPARVPPGRRPSALAARAAAPNAPAAALVCSDAVGQIAVLDPAAIGTPRSPIALTVQLGAGAGERLQWATLPADRGDARLSSTVAPETDATGERPGHLFVRAIYAHPGKTNPYELELRLRPELDHPDVVIRKDQYDIVMNVLNALHPIGVEIRTENVRAHVIEVRDGLFDAFPGYTYPNFRTGSVAPADLDLRETRS